MNITEAIDSFAFKHALFEGKVEFDYVKNDGTLRHAVGTLCEKLLPKTTPMDTYEITFIKWDLDLDDLEKNGAVNLPVRCKVKIFADTPEDEIENELSEALTETYGFCHNGFEYSKLEKKQKKLPEGTIFYYDIDKQAYRSFKIAKLKGWKVC